MKKYIKIVLLNFALVLLSNASLASFNDDSWTNKTSVFLKSTKAVGYNFVKSIFVIPGEETPELAMIRTSKGFVIKSVPVKKDDVNMIQEVISGCKETYKRGVKENFGEVVKCVSQNKMGTAADILVLTSGFDPYGFSQTGSLILQSAQFMQKVYVGVPNIFRLQMPAKDKLMVTGGFLVLASLPVVHAYDSYADARAAYGGWGCNGRKADLALNFRECIEGGKEFKTCYLEAPRDIGSYDGYSFQMHPTESHPELSPVSITNYDKNQLCIISATTPTGLATKICSNMDFSGDVTVAKTNMLFERAHEGLKIGEIAYHGASDVAGEGKCGFFMTRPIQTSNPGSQVVCVASGFEPLSPHQTCIDPVNHVVTVRGLAPTEFWRMNPDLSSPYIVIRDSKRLMIDVRPDTLENRETCSLSDAPIINVTNITCSNPYFREERLDMKERFMLRHAESTVSSEKPCVPYISALDAFLAYWYQRPLNPTC